MMKSILVAFLLTTPGVALAQSSTIIDCNGANNNVPGLDTSKWIVIDRSGDYSNSEAEGYYGGGNVSISNSNLVLTAKKQSVTCHDENMDGSVRNGPTIFAYTSGAIQTASFNFLYGTLEFRAQMPSFAGMWPGSLWLLGSNCQSSNPHSADNIGSCAWDAPGSNEIDIAEFMSAPTADINNMFNNGSHCDVQVSLGFDASEGFHVYSVNWAPGALTWRVDGNTTNTCNTAVPSTAVFPIINLALGGAGGPVNSAQLPQSMLIDYVKVCNTNLTAAQCDAVAGNDPDVIFFDDFTGSSPAPPTGLAATVN